MSPSWRRPLAALLVALLAGGCLSVRTAGRRPSGGEAGGVSVRVFPDDDARRAGRVGPAYVVGELEGLEDGEWRPLFRSLRPAWSVIGLPAGRYRVVFPAVLDEAGHVVELARTEETVRVAAGELTDVEATLSHVSPLLVAVGVTAAVVGAILLHEWLDDHDLPVPPPPPIPSEVARLAFHLTVDLGMAWEAGPHHVDLPPEITSHFPEDGAVLGEPPERIIVSFSEPVALDVSPDEAVVVLGERTGILAGAATADEDLWWVVWEPDAPLPAGERYHVTLAAGAVAGQGGAENPLPSSFSFTVR